MKKTKILSALLAGILSVSSVSLAANAWGEDIDGKYYLNGIEVTEKEYYDYWGYWYNLGGDLNDYDLHFERGDIDCDRRITIEDALYTLKIVIDYEAVNSYECDSTKSFLADCNNDNKVTVDDALIILKYVVGLPDTFNCGKVVEINWEEV